jgi:myxalamid-type polyketide synthase MxaE and MxaD
MPESRALAAMEAALASGFPQVAVAAIDWEALRSLHESRRPRPLTSRLGSRGRSAERPVDKQGKEDLRARLAAAPHKERRDIIQTFVRTTVARVLGVRNPDSIDADKGLFEMGLDSLMSIDLKTRLEVGAGHSLPSALIFDSADITALTEYLAQDMLGDPDEGLSESQLAFVAQARANPERVSESLADLSDEQVDALLHEMLREKETAS